MPIKRPRHKITKTPRVDEGRSRLAESVRARSLPIDVKAADAVKRLRLPG